MVTGRRKPAADWIYPASKAVSSQHIDLNVYKHRHTRMHTCTQVHTTNETEKKYWTTLVRRGPIGWHLNGWKLRRNKWVHFCRFCRSSDLPLDIKLRSRWNGRATPVANRTFHRWIPHFCECRAARDKSDRKTETLDLHNQSCCSQSAMKAATQQERKRTQSSCACQTIGALRYSLFGKEKTTLFLICLIDAILKDIEV